MREYNRRNATPGKVLDSYEGSEDLFFSMGRGYMVVAALSYFGMQKLDDNSTLNVFPDNIAHARERTVKENFSPCFL